MKIEITKVENVFEAKFDNGAVIKTQDSQTLDSEGIPTDLEAKMFVGMISEYILHYLTNEGYNDNA